MCATLTVEAKEVKNRAKAATKRKILKLPHVAKIFPKLFIIQGFFSIHVIVYIEGKRDTIVRTSKEDGGDR